MRSLRTHAHLAAALAGVPILPFPGGAQDAAGDVLFEAYRLDNGLHVILAPDPGATAVAVNLWYDAGSRHEPRGRSGFAHLFEHLMYQGSENVARGGHLQLIERAGGSLNATAGEDRTAYFQTLPPERLNLALWLEADRMRSLGVTAEAMEREIEVVKEERRLRVDNAPYGTSQLQAGHYAAYDSTSCFAYAHSAIGSMEDLDAAELGDVQAFFERYYAPANASLAIVGAFDAPTARALVEEYFGPVPAGSEAPEAECEAPFVHLPVERRVSDPNAQLPAVWISYGTVPRSHPDAPALGILGQILGAGESSRLHDRLVRRERAAVQTDAVSATRAGPGLFQLLAVANQGVDDARLLALLDEEVEAVIDGGIEEAELERARNQVRASAIFGRQSVMGRAEALQAAHHYHGTPEAIRIRLLALEAVSAEDVRRVAATYLRPENRAVVITVPGRGEGGR